MTDTRKRSNRVRMKTAAVLLTLGCIGAVYGCSSDAAPPDESTGGAPGAGGGGGGAPACGMGVNDPSHYPACPSCSGGRCVPKSIVASSGVANLLAACDADNVCVPDNIVAMGENLQLTKCSSIGG